MTDRDPSRSESDAGQQLDGVADGGRSRLWNMCRELMTQLAISGVVISIIDVGGRRSTVASTDVVAARWDETELEVGDGPLHDAVTTTSAQLIADVRVGALNPLVASRFADLGIRAVFAFPLVLGSATVGVAGVYRTTPGDLSEQDLRTALRLVRATTVPAVRAALLLAAHDGTGDSHEATNTRQAPELRREVHQATGMISAQLDVNMTEAFARLRAHAVASEISIMSVAREVVGGGLNFLDLDLNVD